MLEKVFADSHKSLLLKRLVFPLIAVFAQLGTAFCETDSLAIYTVDVPKVLANSIAGKAAQTNIELEAKKSESRLELAKQEIEQLRAGIGKQQSLLSEDALEEKRLNLERKEKEFQRSIQDERQVVAKKNDVEMRKVLAQIQDVVEDLSRKGDYKIIIEKDPRLVLYADERYDLTAEVVKLLNDKQL